MHGGGGGNGAMCAGGGGYSGAAYSTSPVRLTYAAPRSTYSPNTSANYLRAGTPNGSLNYQSVYHANGVGGWGYHNWDNSFRGPYWGVGLGWGWGYPWFPYWGGYPFGWGGYWADYFCPYGPVYATGYPIIAGSYPYPYTYPDDGQYAVNFGNAAGPVIAPNAPQVAAENGEAAGNEGLQYYNEARSAFLQADYRNALRLAGHAGVESPQNVKVHELTSLALFAAGEYKAAATEAHWALALGPPSDWANLYSYYNDADKYTEQLRKLEKSVAETPDSAPDQFLAWVSLPMTGAKAEAKAHFAKAAKLAPNDKLAQHILDQFESNSPITPPKLPPQPQPDEQKGKLL